MTTQCVQVKFELGHSASIRKKPSPEGYTHDWAVFVRGSEGNDISHFVEKVVFILHESFHKPRRAVKEPPFRLEQSGYGGFTMPIEVYLRNREEPKKIQFQYDLYLQVEGEPSIDTCHAEKVTFRNPTEDFRRGLLLSGGVGVLDDGGIPPGASYGIETLGAISSSERTPSKGKPGSVPANVAQKKLKTTAAPTKDPNRHSGTSKHSKETKASSKDGKSRGKPPTKGASKRPPGSSSSEPQAKRKKEHSAKTPKAPSLEKHSSTVQEHSSTKKTPGSSKKKKAAPKGDSTKKEKKADLFVPEFTVEHKPKAPPVETAKKPSLPPFEDELSTGEMEEDPPDSPSSKSTGSFSSLPRGGGAGGALKNLMAEIDDNFEDEDDQDYSIPFKRDPPNSSSFPPVDDDSSSSSESFDEYLKQKQNKKEANAPQPVASKATERVVKKETKVEKKTKVDAKSKSSGDSGKKSSSAKSKDNDAKGPKGGENKQKRTQPADKTTKTKSKTYEKKEAKQQQAVESKTPKSSEAKAKPPKMTEKPKSETKKRSADGKSKAAAEGRTTKSETKERRNVDGKGGAKESVREIERRGSSIQTNNMDYLYELVDLHKRLMNLKDKDKLQKVVDLIGETGDFKITEKTFDFDLCSLDRPTVQKLKEYVPPL